LINEVRYVLRCHSLRRVHTVRAANLGSNWRCDVAVQILLLDGELMTNLQKLHDELEEENSASMALLIQVLIAKRYDLIERAAEVAFRTMKDGERSSVVDVKYRSIYIELIQESGKKIIRDMVK
jgi:hypothetical protein